MQTFVLSTKGQLTRDTAPTQSQKAVQYFVMHAIYVSWLLSASKAVELAIRFYSVQLYNGEDVMQNKNA